MILRSPSTISVARWARGAHPPTRVRHSSSSSSSTASPVPRSLDPPVKSSLADFLPPTSIPDPTFLEPLSSVFLALPPSLAVSYAAAIPLATVLYRTATTLPVVLWQRRRSARFAELVLPKLKHQQSNLAIKTRDECRRLGKSYQEYQQVFQKRAKKLAYALAREYRCSPRLTLILPPLVHIPIFVTATLTLRDACTRAVASLPLSPADLTSSSYLTPTALDHLHHLASTSFLWCPSLVLPDPTMLLPLAVGVASLLNVEVSAKNRLNQAQLAQSTLEGRSSGAAAEEDERLNNRRGGGGGGGPGMSASEKRRIVARKARQGEVVRVRGYATAPSGSGTPIVGGPKLNRTIPPSSPSMSSNEEDTKPNTARIVTNVLRFASVAFIPVAGLAPSAVCLYWIASNLFTLVQNGTFAMMDQKRARDKRVGMILQGRV